MTALPIKKLPNRCMWAAVLFCTVYQSYRYPLQINSSGTSHTYSDTPAYLQLAKYLVVLLVCFISVLYIPGRQYPFRKWFLAVFACCMSIYPILKLFGAESGHEIAYPDIAFWPLAALILVLSIPGVDVAALDRYFRFVFIYALASTAIEVFLFLSIGRLPALAYEGSFSIRFGGFLDDPNGFAALLYMLMGWVYYRFSGWKLIIAQTSLVLCVLLTQSLTAIGFLGMLALLLIVNRFIRRPRPILAMTVGAIFAVMLCVIWSSLAGIVSTIAELRSGSVNAHLSQVTTTKIDMGSDWLFGSSSYLPYESWWLGSLINFGLPWYLLSLCVVATLVLSALRAFRHASGTQRKAVTCAVLMLSCYFVVGNINLPFFGIFPINFLVFFFSYLIFFGKIREENLHFSEIPATLSHTLRKSFNVNADPLHRPALD